MVAVLDELGRLLRRPGAEVDGQHRLGIDEAAPLDELVRAEGVRLDGPPREVCASRPFVPGADPVTPVVVADEVPARIPDHRHAQAAERVRHIGTHPARIRVRTLRVVDAAVDRTAEVFQETAEDASIDRRNCAARIERHGGTLGRHISERSPYALARRTPRCTRAMPRVTSRSSCSWNHTAWYEAVSSVT